MGATAYSSSCCWVYDQRRVYKRGPIGYVALTHFTSRVRAVLVTVAILFWKSNWTGGTATFPFRQVCWKNQKGWNFELHFFLEHGEFRNTRRDPLVDRFVSGRTACYIKSEEWLVAHYRRMGLCAENPLSFRPNVKLNSIANLNVSWVVRCPYENTSFEPLVERLFVFPWI